MYKLVNLVKFVALVLNCCDVMGTILDELFVNPDVVFDVVVVV